MTEKELKAALANVVKQHSMGMINANQAIGRYLKLLKEAGLIDHY